MPADKKDWFGIEKGYQREQRALVREMHYDIVFRNIREAEARLTPEQRARRAHRNKVMAKITIVLWIFILIGFVYLLCK
ncbi:MAG: hypothetical protein LBS72_07120 [Oscillospiraceae bacterium]|jgi:hypothetical protein|nr:hypothetical protein [Oscillospiraceae bacterium]